ncbi:Roundabout 2, partial [Ataeniobius toweri]|nr:Roundabout 2 [Ataeniobius toweri]
MAVGETASFECQPPRGHPEPTIFWRKDKTRLDLKDDRITVRGGKLTISNTRKSDSGIYVCVASNMVGERESEKAQLSVFERPAFLQRPANQVVLVDESVEFRCQVHGDPPPALRWKKEDVDVPRGRYDIRYEREDFLLRIKKASVSDQGTFTCIAENRVGKAEASAYLTIRARPVEAPQFVVRPRDQIVAQGRTATFPCETRGKPQPTVFWQREGSKDLLFPNQPAQGDERVTVSVNGELTISSVQRSDAGYYICQALTVAGSIMAKAQLEVADASKGRPPPIIRQGPSNQTQALGGVSVLKCQASGDPEPTVTWRKNGANLLGQDPRFSLLEHGSLQIQNTRLSDSGLYTCVATSSSGETSWSAYLDVRDSTDLMDFMSHNTTSLPGPPSKPEVTDVTKSSISLSWEPGPEAGSPVSSYVIEAFGQSVSNSWQTVADHVKTTEFTVKDLRPNTVYLFIIRTVNAQGLGDPSPMSEPVRTQDISPTVQGVDHRRVQKELGDVVVNMHNPVVLSSTSVQVTWT